LHREQRVDINLCRESIERLLVEECGLLAQLETLLDTEHRHLIGNDIDAFEQAGAARQTCMGKLVRIEDERRSLCRMSGKSVDRAGLQQLLAWCDPKNTLQRRWLEINDRATRCRERNDRNGIVVAARLRRVEGMLNVITGRDQAPATYGPQRYAAAPVGRMIRSEA
jgi:flagellar biosynthesis protein FlgN